MRKLDLRPSNAERLLNCNLSTLLPEIEKTDEQKKYLEERSKDHERLSKGRFLDSEKNCKAFHDRVIKHCNGKVFRETTIVHDLNGYEFKGTPDLFGFCEKGKNLYVVDYKTGYHLVLAQENMQLLSYAALIFLRRKEWDIKNFCLSILNTQRDIVSTFNITAGTVLGHIARIQRNVKFTYEDETFFAIKGKWCNFCPSKNYCPLLNTKSNFKKYCDLDTGDLLKEYESRKKEITRYRKKLKESNQPD